MKIAIGYPPLDSEKGIPFLGQNRQFQWGKRPWYAYPMVPAYAATLLKNAGHQVVWLDGIAAEQKYQDWLENLQKEKPDLLMMETKTPVVKKHWWIIDQLKIRNPKLKIILVGDHVTALPRESMKNCQVDYLLTGGDYDFLLLNLVNHLAKKEKLEPGIWYRQGKKIVNTGKFSLNHDLNRLPFADRELTRWQLYAYKNSNYSRKPGTYTMFGRDCWWGRCTFCVTGETQICTKEGFLPIKEIVDEGKKLEVLTHEGRYRKIVDWHKRKVNEEIIRITPLYFPYELKLTGNHKVYCLPKNNLKKCVSKSAGAYICKPGRISQFLNCKVCNKNLYSGYKILEMESKKLKKGDYVAFPIDRAVKNQKFININDVLEKEPTTFLTQKKIAEVQIEKIMLLASKGYSQRKISRELKLDRETINRYLFLQRENSLKESKNQYSYSSEGVSFKYGVNKIMPQISVEKDFFFLVGLYLAEGHTTYCKSRPNSAVIGWTFNKNEDELIGKTKLFFKRYFGISLNIALNKKNNTVQLYIGSTIVAKFFKILFGGDCYSKKLPFDYLHLPLEKQRALLKGVFRGDGHFRKRENKAGGSEYIYETVSKKLAEQVFLILLRFDAIPSFKIIQPGKKSVSVKYKITLFASDILKVFPEVRLSTDRICYKRGFVLGNFVFLPVIKVIKQNFEGFVYNLTAEDDHSYVADFVTVKNCSWTTLYPGERYRVVSPKRALDEIGNIIENLPVKEIMDDSGTFPTGDWLREFCRGMIKRSYNHKIKFDCNMRFNASLAKKDYQLMAQAGFRFILYGLESASQKTLDRVNKNLKVNTISKNLNQAKKAGLWPHITAMVGYPWETKGEALETLDFVRELFKKGWIDSLQATIVIPYPGTPLFEECQKNDWLKTEDWDRYDMSEPIMKTPMKDKEIIGLVRGIFNSFWTPEFFFRKLKEGLTDWDKFKYYLSFASSYLGKLGEFR